MQKTIRLFQSFLDWLEKASMALACTILGVLLANESLGIFSDFLGYSIPWITEVSVILFAWVIFLGTGIVTRKGSHISLDFLVEKLPDAVKPLLLVVNTALMLFVAFVMIFYGTRQALFVGQYQKTVYLQISLFYLYFSVPAGGVLVFLNALGVALPGGRKEEVSKLAKIEENPLY